MVSKKVGLGGNFGSGRIVEEKNIICYNSNKNVTLMILGSVIDKRYMRMKYNYLKRKKRCLKALKKAIQ